MSLAWEGSPAVYDPEMQAESFYDSLPDPPETPAEREYRLWREYMDEYDFSEEELHQEEYEEARRHATND